LDHGNPKSRDGRGHSAVHAVVHTLAPETLGINAKAGHVLDQGNDCHRVFAVVVLENAAGVQSKVVQGMPVPL
jgi:hypothetical protein